MWYKSGAQFNEDRTKRYLLWRIWDDEKPLLMMVCLNPSTANEVENDNTVTRCINFAKSHSYGGLYLGNLFPIRSTDPSLLYDLADPRDDCNDKILIETRMMVDFCIIAWGNHGLINGHGKKMAELLAPVKCFRITKQGMPQHPLYLPKNIGLIDYKGG